MIDPSAIDSMLARERVWFEQWQTAADFERRRAQVRRSVDGNFQFNRTSAKWLLEAWLLSRFARLKAVSEIRLNDCDRPDAFFLRDSEAIPLELTEIIEPGRVRGIEYRPEAPHTKMDPVENWVRRAEAIPEALRIGIEKKQSKIYSEKTELLVYLNIDEWGIRQNRSEAAIKAQLSKSPGPFGMIYVLWKNKLFDSSGAVAIDPAVSLNQFDDDDA